MVRELTLLNIKCLEMSVRLSDVAESKSSKVCRVNVAGRVRPTTAATCIVGRSYGIVSDMQTA